MRSSARSPTAPPPHRIYTRDRLLSERKLTRLFTARGAEIETLNSIYVRVRIRVCVYAFVLVRGLNATPGGSGKKTPARREGELKSIWPCYYDGDN